MEKEAVEKLLASVQTTVEDTLEKNLASAVSPLVAKEVRGLVEKMQAERKAFGMDRSGLTDEQKEGFADMVKAAAFGTKAQIGEVDAQGGYLVQTEVAAAILRIAASVGLVLSQATKWPMSTDALDVPAYTGAFLEGEYLTQDSNTPKNTNEGAVTTLSSFGAVNLQVRKWQLAFALGNDLLADAKVNLADWLLALASEALANMVDKTAFTRGTNLGILGNANVPTVSLTGIVASGFTMEKAAEMVGGLEESVLDGAAFYMHRTVWAVIRTLKDGSGRYIFAQDSAAFASAGLSAAANGLKPVGFILGYPVYTNRHMPTAAANAEIVVFGNMKAIAYGDRADMTVSKYTSGNFGGKEIALNDQTGLVFRNRHDVRIALPAAFTKAKLAAS